MNEERGGVATAVWAPSQPSVAVETTLPDYDEYEVRIFDAQQGRHPAAAIEIVSPANIGQLTPKELRCLVRSRFLRVSTRQGGTSRPFTTNPPRIVLPAA
jgi:hypothetical protein